MLAMREAKEEVKDTLKLELQARIQKPFGKLHGTFDALDPPMRR